MRPPAVDKRGWGLVIAICQLSQLVGSKSPEGRQPCAEAKRIHGNDTRQARSERAEAMRRLRELEDLGHELCIVHGPRMRGGGIHLFNIVT